MQAASGSARVSTQPTEGLGENSWPGRYKHTRWSALCPARYAPMYSFDVGCKRHAVIHTALKLKAGHKHFWENKVLPKHSLKFGISTWR